MNQTQLNQTPSSLNQTQIFRFFRSFKFILGICLLQGIFNTTVLAAPKDTTQPLSFLDRIVAVVNRDAIPESELNRQTDLLMMRLKQNEMSLPPMSVLRQQLLDKIVLEKLQLQMAKEAGIEVTDANVNQTIEDMAARDGVSLHQMQQFVEEQGLNFDQFKANIKNEMIISRLQQKEIGPQITISNTEVDHFINSPLGQGQDGTEYRIGHILISLPETPSKEEISQGEKKAADLFKQLKSGRDFSELAMAKSAGPQALNGGDLGWRKAEELPTLFAKLAPTLTKNQLHGPVQNESGFHIIKLIDKRNSEATVGSKDDRRSKAMDILYQRRFEEKLVTWLRRLRDEAEVQIYLNENT